MPLWEQYLEDQLSPISPFYSKRIARAAFPALIRGATTEEAARIAGAAKRFGATTRARAGLAATGMEQAGALARLEEEETGKTHRQRLAIAGDKAIQRMITERALKSRAMSEEGAYQREELRASLAKHLASEEESAFERGLSSATNLLEQETSQGGYTYQPGVATPTAKKRRKLQTGDTVTMPDGTQRYLRFD